MIRQTDPDNVLDRTVRSLLDETPTLADLLDSHGLETSPEATLGDVVRTQQDEEALPPEEWASLVQAHIRTAQALQNAPDARIGTLTIQAGRDKTGQQEGFEQIDVHAGEVIAIVGPTGSGKSRLLADIEWLATGDTPTGRTILLDHRPATRDERFSPHHKRVAQLSQNMNFVMDVAVGEFLDLHARSRLSRNPQDIVPRILQAANDLAGEQFSVDTPLTSLSGGQSRALMIADTAILSRSPIVLIDEIENAGVDRGKALELLVRQDKIVLLATHDPVLALRAKRRLIIRNGAISQVRSTTEAEQAMLAELEAHDARLGRIRQALRTGQELPRL